MLFTVGAVLIALSEQAIVSPHTWKDETTCSGAFSHVLCSVAWSVCEPDFPIFPLRRCLSVSLREAIQNIQHGNELLKSDLAWEARESRLITNPAAAAEIQRLQSEADAYAKKTEQASIHMEFLHAASYLML